MNALEWIICALIACGVLQAAWRWTSARMHAGLQAQWEAERAQRARVLQKLVAEYYARQIEASHKQRSE